MHAFPPGARAACSTTSVFADLILFKERGNYEARGAP